ncbi:MAG TPA: hypothetical protein DEF51_40905, partial [Myxococcales bacterium]|nr:hypothetical protein [Myxococcales bacterium]
MLRGRRRGVAVLGSAGAARPVARRGGRRRARAAPRRGPGLRARRASGRALRGALSAGRGARRRDTVEAVSEPREGYVSIGLLARGGMGEVRLGLRQAGAFRRLVAIKRLRAEHRADESFRRMFVDEGRLAGLVRHPNVVSVLDVGEDEEGPFLVMDFVEGVTAHQVLKRLSAEGERLPLQVAARVAHQVALGLTAVHELCTTEGEALGLIHRDVSPQ